MTTQEQKQAILAVEALKKIFFLRKRTAPAIPPILSLPKKALNG